MFCKQRKVIADMAYRNGAEPSQEANAAMQRSARFAAAQSAVERLTKQYPHMARASLAETRTCYARSGELDPEEVMLELRRFAHNFTGQGASFNYPLITDIANSLRAHLHSCGSLAALRPTVVEAHFNAIEEVLDKQLSGDGGAEGEAIMARLTGMNA